MLFKISISVRSDELRVKSIKISLEPAKSVRKVSPGPQTYQIKATRADSVQTCRLFSI